MRFRSAWAVIASTAFAAVLSSSYVASAGDTATAAAQIYASDTLMSPMRHQLDLELLNMSDFVDDSSLVRRREASIPGTALHLGPDLGLSTMQQFELFATFWFDDVNAIQAQVRYFFLYGGTGLNAPVTFNGNLIAPGQSLSTSGTTWFTGGLFYARRLTPWLDRQLSSAPPIFCGWDTRAKIGLEFVYLDFQLNNAHPALIRGNLDTRGRFHDQELPVPTVGIELRRRLSVGFAVEITAQGNWINKWNSLRSQGGTVYLSQSSFETHWRVIYTDPRLWGLRPFLGFTYFYFREAETSSTIGNLIRTQTYGPEVGITYSL